MNGTTLTTAVVALLAATAISGCTSEARSGSNAAGVPVPPSAAPGPAGTAQRLAVGSASRQDIAASLAGNGIDDSDRWAKVVFDNRPYPADDPAMTKLRQVLSQNGADQATVAKITNSLSP
jgi:hypothetical protein